jgi:CRISPR-associated protein Cas5t
MKKTVLRIRLKQAEAHFRKAESLENKMTYPLPPYSTIIGALHNACKYREYHPMDISVQGVYESIERKIYYDNAYLNSTQNDRGILVKLLNPNYFSAGYKTVAIAKKNQGNDFRKGITIDVISPELLSEYRYLRDLRDRLIDERKAFQDNNKLEQTKLKSELEKLAEDSKKFESISQKLETLAQDSKSYEQEYKKKRQQEYEEPYSYFATLTKSIRSYEVIYNLETLIHVAADDEVLSDIERNIYNLTSVGRSEDFVDLLECKKVSIFDTEEEKTCNNGVYINVKAYDEQVGSKKDGDYSQGTVYRLPKDYKLKKGNREFNHIDCIYLSNFTYEPNDEYQIYFDEEDFLVQLN